MGTGESLSWLPVVLLTSPTGVTQQGLGMCDERERKALGSNYAPFAHHPGIKGQVPYKLRFQFLRLTSLTGSTGTL